MAGNKWQHKKHPKIRMLSFGVLLSFIALNIILSCYKGNGLNPTGGGDESGIRGRITFQGDWPDSTKEVRVAVLKNYPDRKIQDKDSIFQFVLSNLVLFSDTIPRFTDHYDYQLLLKPNTYAWILVAWFPDTPTYLFDTKELGAFYGDQTIGMTPTPVEVVSGILTPDINILADFTNVYREVPFF